MKVKVIELKVKSKVKVKIKIEKYFQCSKKWGENHAAFSSKSGSKKLKQKEMKLRNETYFQKLKPEVLNKE